MQPEFLMASTALIELPPVDIKSSITITFLFGSNFPSIKFSKPCAFGFDRI